MRIEFDLLVSSFDTADRKTMKSLHTNPECQQLNVTPVLSALNYIYFFYVVSLFGVVSLFCQDIHKVLYKGNF